MRKNLVAEFLGTYILVFAGTGAIMSIVFFFMLKGIFGA